MKNQTLKIVMAGLAGGFTGNAVLGLLFTSSFLTGLLYNPQWQSPLFLEITPQRDIPASVAGLVVLSISHGWLFSLWRPSMPGNGWVQQGLFWGLAIWMMYWLFQEWFIYHTLLNEPLWLNLVELAVLLAGALVEGTVIAWFWRNDPLRQR